MKKFIAILVVLVASLLVVTGCGSEQEILEPTEGLEYTLLDNGTYAVSKGSAKDCQNIVIPNQYNGKRVTTIDDYAFHGCTNLTSITILNGVTTIGVCAFTDCTGLTNVTIPDSVNTIKGSAFSGCTGLTSITIPDSVIRICESAFMDCTSLTSITIPNSVIAIEWHTFGSCTSLTSISISKSVTTIGGYAFDDCTSLTNIKVNKNNPNYSSEDGVLFDKNKTKLIRFPEGKSITTYTIPNSVTTIEWHSFYNCANLTSITIPNSVTTIGIQVFDACTSLTNINVDKNNPNYSSEDGVLFDKNKTELIRFLEGKSTTTYTIPKSVTEIGNDAFEACTSLTSVTIPNSVTTIGDYAFDDCTSLKTINFDGTVAQWKSIEKGIAWGWNTPAKKVVCTDGEVSIK